MWRRFRVSSYIVFALALAVAVATGLVCWLSVGPAAATPGMSCDLAGGSQNAPGCHKPATTTTAAPTTTTAAPTTTTAKPATTTTKAGTVTTAATTDTSTTGTDTTGVSTSTTAGSTTTGPSTSTTGGATSGTDVSVTTLSTVNLEGVSATGARYLDQSNCLACHGDPSLTTQRADGTTVALFVDTEELPQAVHRYLDCTTCHTSDPHQVETPLTKLSQAEKCGSCHNYQYTLYMASVHGIPQPGGNEDPATCADCHAIDFDPHNVVRVLEPKASTYPKNIADTCARCHDDPELMDKYGIVEKVYDTYMRSFHGKTMELSPGNATIQQLDTATCVNCHGAHNVMDVDDPSSPVAGMENLLATCQLHSCHPDAGPEFVEGFLGHKEANSEFLPEVYWGGNAFYIFSRAMLAGGALLVATSIGLRGIPWIKNRFGSRSKTRNKKED